jgi:hypothetical protein
MSSKSNSPVLNPLARQNIYISPSLQPLNRKLYVDTAYESFMLSDASSDVSSDASYDKNHRPFFSSNDSLSSFEDYRIDIEEEKKEDDRIKLSNCNRGIISSMCCSLCSRN